MSESETPGNGLYRTTLPLPGKEQQVPAGRLVYFHAKSDQGQPAVVLPHQVVDNRWQFGNQGFLVQDPEWPSTLIELPRQGFYTVTRELRIGQGVKLPEGVLVQLGFTAQGEAVIFPGVLEAGNRIAFQQAGAKISDLQLDALQVIDFKLLAPPPAAKEEPKLH